MSTKFSDLREESTAPAGSYVVGYDPSHTGEGSKNFRIGADKLAGSGGASSGGVSQDQFLDLVDIITGTSSAPVQGGSFFSDTFNNTSAVNLPASTRAVYDSVNKKFTPTVADNSVILHFDGAQGSTDIVDVNGHPFTLSQDSGIARIDTQQSKFGGSSLLIANGANAVSPSNVDFGVGAGDFTVEFFMYSGAGPQGAGTIFEARSTTSNFLVAIIQNKIWYGNSTLGYLQGTVEVASRTEWIHVAVTRASGVVRTYINGVLDGTKADATDYGNSMSLRLGTRGDGGDKFAGYLDEFRFAKKAQYTGNFAPPTAPFVPPPADSQYKLVSQPWESSTVPSTIALRAQIRTLTGITESPFVLNTHIRAFVSRDGGATWTQATLTVAYTRGDGMQVVTASAGVDSQPSRRSIAYKFELISGRSIEINSVIEYIS